MDQKKLIRRRRSPVVTQFEKVRVRIKDDLFLGESEDGKEKIFLEANDLIELAVPAKRKTRRNEEEEDGEGASEGFEAVGGEAEGGELEAGAEDGVEPTEVEGTIVDNGDEKLLIVSLTGGTVDLDAISDVGMENAEPNEDAPVGLEDEVKESIRRKLIRRRVEAIRKNRRVK